MGTALVSLIGKGRPTANGGRSGRSEYAQTVYRFEGDDFVAAGTDRTSLFAAALMRRARQNRRAVDRWLVMGTPQSQWADLWEALPETERHDLLDVWDPLQTQVDRGCVEPSQLAEWETRLAAKLAPTRCLFRLTGLADTPESQRAMWEALVEATDGVERVVLDITHGFRHMPVLLAFMLQPLRWTRNLRQVELYYGAWEMRQDDVAPVLRLPLCNALQNAAEAAATCRLTGRFEALAECAGLSNEGQRRVAEIAFCDGTNRLPGPDTILAVRRELNEPPPPGPAAEIRAMLSDALSPYLDGEDAARAMRRRFLQAREHGDWLKAVVLLWEALLVAGQRCYPDLAGADSWTQNARDATRARLHDAERTILSPEEHKLFLALRNLRNSVAHGTPGSAWGEAHCALKNRSDFEALLDKGAALLKRLIERGDAAAAGNAAEAQPGADDTTEARGEER